jgi:outer membrane protein assembly factor BamB
LLIGSVVTLSYVVSHFWRGSDRPLQTTTFSPPRQTSTDAISDLGPTDWAQFRGPDNLRATHATVPLEWNDTQNLLWKKELPGPGSSSPIVVGNRVIVTCYSGYGIDPHNPGDPSKLKRHLLCLDRTNGKTLWTQEVASTGTEDAYRGYLTEHGFASHTPVSDGETVFAFFGKSGVYAYSLDGREKWHAEVGQRSDSRRWGSSASPILWKDKVIVNASSECRAVLALDKATGEEVWRAPAESLDLSFATPVPVQLDDGRSELVLCVPGELWGLDAAAGTLNWFATVPMTGNISPSVTVHDGIVYSTGGYRGRGTVAVEAGGQGDVTDSHIRWSIRESSYVPSPVWHDGHLYWCDNRGIAICLDAKTGKRVYQRRIAMDGRGGNPIYASPLLVRDALVVVTRTAGTVILAARPEFEQLHTNTLSDESQFNATPAVSGDNLFLRSNVAIYCVGSTD